MAWIELYAGRTSAAGSALHEFSLAGPLVISFAIIAALSFSAASACFVSSPTLVVGYWGSGLVGRMIAVIPARMIYPFIFITSFVAAHALRQTLFDMGVMLFFGVVGYVFKRLDFSAPAFIIAFILGEGAEQAVRQSMMLSGGGPLIFFERPIALVFFAIGLLVIALRIQQPRRAANVEAGS